MERLSGPIGPPIWDVRDQEPLRFQMGVHRTDAEKVAIGRKLLEVKASLPRGQALGLKGRASLAVSRTRR